MEQKPAGDNPGVAPQQPEIILSPDTTAASPPAANKICPNCGTVNPPPSVFCLKCGNKLPDATNADKKICAGCHAPNAASAQYCFKCGLQLPDKLGGSSEKQMQYAGFWIRLVASLLDGIFLYIVDSIIMAIVLVVVYGADFSTSWLSDLQSYSTISESEIWSFFGVFLILILVSIVVNTAYNTIAIGKWGRTLGKAALKLKVVKPDGSRVSYWRALGRALAYYLNQVTFSLSFLIIAFTNKKRGLHDYIADTIVIKTD